LINKPVKDSIIEANRKFIQFQEEQLLKAWKKNDILKKKIKRSGRFGLIVGASSGVLISIFLLLLIK